MIMKDKTDAYMHVHIFVYGEREKQINKQKRT